MRVSRSVSYALGYGGLLPLLVILLAFCGPAWAGAWDLPAGTGAMQVLPKGELPENIVGTIRKQPGSIVADGFFGTVLRLNKGEFLTLDTARFIDPAAGCVSFWVRPHWDESDKASHTFLSFPWQDGKMGYFTFSRGWWEPNGAGLTYLIGNNQDYSNMARKIRYEKGEWTHLTAVWKSGTPGYIRLYVNGILAAQDTRYTGGYRPGKELYLGSDQGTPLANGRWADVDFAELAFVRRTLTDQEIRALYEHQKPVRRELPVHKDGSLSEWRAIFDEGIGWQTEKGAREIIQRIKKAGFNVYIPCVWHGNGARYPTSLIAAARNQQFAGRDPLARLISIAHENGIQVHPWLTVTLREKEFSREHGEFFSAATPADAFDLHRSAFQRFVIGLITDVAKRYPVDGINLDYIRTMGTCRCTSCVTDYRVRYDRDLVHDVAHPNADGTLEPHLQEWQDTAVEAVVREISQRVRELRPGCILSVDGNPQSYPNQEGRQEARWANSGLVDVVFDMEYADPPDVERHHLAMAQFRDPHKLVLLISNHDWKSGLPQPKPADQLRSSVEYVRERWGKGLGIYLYSMLSDEQVEMLAGGPFSRASRPPDRME
ncbi:MAG TPA: family 10 glycosylhydrolase [Nitrospirota bacterium]|nr:family 10 glycosylhydrolase [Nitrospirota bacterium]